MPGRETKLTPERQKKIVKAILEGNYFETACRLAGISDTTGWEWLSRGEGKHKDRESSEVYADFADAVRKAEAELESNTVKQVRKGIPDNSRLGLEYLARRFHQRWGTRDQLTILRKLADDIGSMSNDEVLALLRGRGAGPGDAEAGGGGGAEAGPARNGRHEPGGAGDPV